MTLEFNPAAGDGLVDLTSFDSQRYQYPVTTTAATATSSQPSTSPAAAAAALSGVGPMASSRHPQGGWPMPLGIPRQQLQQHAHQQHQQHHGLAAAASMTPGQQTAVSSPTGSHSQAHSPSQQSSSPLQQSPYQSASSAHSHSPPMLTDWTLLQHQQQNPPVQDMSPFITENSLIPFNNFTTGFQTSAIDYLPATTQAALESGLRMEQAFNNVSPIDDAHTMQHHWDGMGMANWQDFGTSLQLPTDGLPRFHGSMGSQSPTGTYLEVLSLPSSDSNNEWTQVNMYQNYDAYQQSQVSVQAQNNTGAIFNPSETLHLRNPSDASHSDASVQPVEFSSGSYEEVPFNISPFSPGSDTYSDPSNHRNCFHGESHHAHGTISPTTAVTPMAVKTQPSSPTNRTSPSSGSGSVPSPPTNTRRNSGPKKGSPTGVTKSTTKVIRRTSNSKKDGTLEKKVGRRKGPLLPEQRKQASEIRKLRACLRCKFLKKTCDKGEPCGGCQPSHARLWQVPCTRIDIKDIGFFMKDWKADYERHLSRGVSVYNVKGFAPKENLMWITHGYGFCLPVMVREVYVADESCFQVDWVESYQVEQEPIEFELRTEGLDVGEGGISTDALAEYLDKHIEHGFENFIDDHFEGTPFVTEVFKTAYRFYQKEKSPTIRKALKLVLAYNLTMHITLVEQQGSETLLEGQIDDEDSKFYGKYVAPVLINFQIKCAMADMWRELQRDILEELSSLYSSVYSGDRLKNWPTIFMLATILLAVWEEMQFDCHYRVPDPAAVEKFCADMETIPVGVITGLFHAISQKLPALTDWQTDRHGHLLNNNAAVCDAMTEVRDHVLKHESYLRTRNNAKFDRYDFDSLSNKFLSKLVIKAN